MLFNKSSLSTAKVILPFERVFAVNSKLQMSRHCKKPNESKNKVTKVKGAHQL